MTGVEPFAEGSPYAGYLYSYPHKTAYREIQPAVDLAELWSREDRSALSLYLHVPFCEMRCGFCNLFTRSRPPGERVSAWLGTLRRQAAVVRQAIGPAQFERFAIGGGTPTMLEPGQIESLFDILGGFGVLGRPSSVETSPATATPDRLAVLKAAGVTRVSIGVQSFEAAEVQAAQRQQSNVQVAAALDRIRAADFAVLNLDLIYGIPGQSAMSWERSLRAALEFRPEEIYLYPLYVRPLTGMAVRARNPDDALRTQLYLAGRDLLLAEGYVQCSMRMFTKSAESAPTGAYRCQEDGMIGLGVGARSYASGLHYSTDYAVRARGVEAILDDWITRTDAEFAVASHGIRLDASEQARRRLILTLLAREVVVEVPPELEPAVGSLLAAGLARRTEHGIELTDAGVARSDAIGPALISPAVRSRMAAWESR